MSVTLLFFFFSPYLTFTELLYLHNKEHISYSYVKTKIEAV